MKKCGGIYNVLASKNVGPNNISKIYLTKRVGEKSDTITSTIDNPIIYLSYKESINNSIILTLKPNRVRKFLINLASKLNLYSLEFYLLAYKEELEVVIAGSIYKVPKGNLYYGYNHIHLEKNLII